MIGVFDSGAGGLSVLREAVTRLPQAHFVYYADNAHCPYGEKTTEYVIDRARFITEFLLKKGADIIVVACNTATSAAIATLREEYSNASDPLVRERVGRLTEGRRDHVMFIGMEPAVKPAVAMTKSGVVGVLATEGTLRGSKYLNARKLHSENVRLVERRGLGYVEMVETGEVNEATVEGSLRPLLDAGADTIVLGCSHYPFLLEELKRAAKRLAPEREIVFIDSAPAVAERLVNVMREEGIDGATAPKPDIMKCHDPSTGFLKPGFLKPGVLKPGAVKPDVELYSSGNDAVLKKLYSAMF